MDSFISSKYGLVKALYYQRVEHKIDKEKIFVISTPSNDSYHVLGYKVDIVNGSGAGINKKQTIISAIGEHIERYSGTFIRDNRMVKNKTYLEMQQQFNEQLVLSPSVDLNLYAEFQYKTDLYKKKNIVPFTDNAKINWIKGMNLLTKKDIYVPVDFISLKMIKHTQNVNIPTSSGLACGSSRESALLNGIYEVLERDAFCFRWWTQTSCPIVREQDIQDTHVRSLMNNGKSKLYILDATTDLKIPVFIGMISNEKGSNLPSRVLGAACHIDPQKALNKAVIETLHTYGWAQSMYHDSIGIEYENYDEKVMSFDDHVKLYSKDEYAEKADILLQKNKYSTINKYNLCNDFNNEREELNFVLSMLEKKGYEPIAVNLTTRDIQSVGLHVYRVYIPGLIQLDGPHAFRHWGGKRLYHLKQEMGLIDRELTIHDLSQVPHPFP